MALTTINITPDFVSNDLISEQANPSALARIASPSPLDLQGRDTQVINFDGEMQIFAEDFAGATDNEKSKKSNNASNTSQRITPITFQYSQRFPKRFLTMYGANAYNNHGEGLTFSAGMPQSVMAQLLTNPYQQNILGQFRAAVNAAAGRALDYAAIFGINPYDKAASQVARINDFLLNKASKVTWTAPDTPTPGNTAASAALRQTVRDLGVNQADYDLQGAITGSYMGAIGDETTTIGSSGTFAGGIPLAATQVNIANVPFAVSPTIANEAAATGSGALTGVKLDGVVGAFRNRFRYGVIPLTGIEVFDTGNPDDGAKDLAAVNQVLLRVEIAIGWGFLGGSEKFRAIVHSATAATPKA